MTIGEVQEILKNMSAQELAQVQNAIVLSQELDDEARLFCLALIAQELNVRRNEGVSRKLERFWNRHGDSTLTKAALVGLGALLGIQLS